MKIRRPGSREHASLLLRVCALAALSTSACTEADTYHGYPEEEQPLGRDTPRSLLSAGEAALLAADSSSKDAEVKMAKPRVTIARPDGSYTVDVAATGTGCPRGTWRVSLERDGERIEAHLTAMDLDGSTRVSRKDCRLRYILRSPAATSFAVRSVQVPAYAFMEAGAEARFASVLRLGAQPPVTFSKEVRGPTDDSVELTYEPPADAVTWSPCGTQHEVQLDYAVRLFKMDPAATAYVNISDLAVLGPPITLLLQQRACVR